MNKENKTSDKQQKGNDFIADVVVSEAKVCSYCKDDGWVKESGVLKPCAVCYMNSQN